VATFYLKAGVPLVLPYNEEGWFVFPVGGDFNADVTAAPGINVALVAVWIRE
jgi:hypothetical protein